MTPTILISYFLLILGIIIWAVLIPTRKMVSTRTMEGISVFGGAFLLGSCFINLVPHMYLEGFSSDIGGMTVKMGLAVMVGFLVQMLLERLTNGIEHGHNHSDCHECEHHEEHPHHVHPVTGLIVGLSIHAFLEGMPLVDCDGDIHQSLLYGIIFHNIPIALVMIGLFLNNRYSFAKSFLLLLLFAAMTPLGSLCGLYLIPENETLECLIMGMVVGILLHVSVSILFDQDHYKFSWLKLALIIIAFVAAYYTPGCPEIYG